MKSKTEKLFGIMNVLTWIVYIGLCIRTGSIIISYFVSIGNAEAAKDLYKGMDLYAYRNYSFLHYTFLVVYKVALYAVQAYAAFLIIDLLKGLKSINRPFTDNVVQLMQKISYCIVCLWLVTMAFNIHTSILEKETGISVSPISGEFVFLAGIVYVFAQVFKRGAEIQSENELTI